VAKLAGENHYPAAEINYNLYSGSSHAAMPSSYQETMDLQRDLVCCFQLDGKLQYSNPAFNRFFIVEDCAEQKLSFMDFIPLPLHKPVNEKLSGLTGTEAETTFQTRSKDGQNKIRTLLWICHYLTPSLIQASARDITDSINCQQALNDSEQLDKQLHFQQFLMETIPNPVYYLDPKGRLIECNRAYAELLGQAKEELIGNQHLAMYKQEQAEALHYSARPLIDSGSLSYDRVMEFPDGRKAELLIHEAIVYDNEANPIGLLGVLTDLTEHREMQRTIAQLDQSRIMGQIAAAMGHEVRNPMTTVRGFLQLLNENEANDSTGNKEYYDLMIEEIDRANSIITDFLSLGKVHTDLKPENLNRIMENSYLILSAEAKKHDHVIQMVLDEVPVIPLDFRQIRQLIFNLARNGLESMTSPGTLTIRTGKNHDSIILSIQDQGSGIDPSIRNKLGKPFVTTKEKGTGLGLAVCCSIVERHGAQLEVDTTEKGSIFNIKFPLLKDNFAMALYDPFSRQK